MKQDLDQLNLLSIFHLILGILTSLFSFVFFIHIGLGIAALNGQLDEKGSPMPPGFGWMFIIMGSLAFLFCMAMGIVSIIASKKLKMHKSRIFCIVVAGIECINMPLGTVLGIFTLILLMKESVIRLFANTLPEIPYQPDQPGPGTTG